MTTKTCTSHKCNFFSSIRRFFPHRGCQEGSTQNITLPKNITLFLAETFEKLHNFIKGGHDNSCPPAWRATKSMVVVFDDLEVEKAASSSEFIELIVFYDDWPTVQVKSILKTLSQGDKSWHVISASTPRGVPIITNYVFQAVDLAEFIKLLAKDSTNPIQELLAYRTANLHDAIILSCSKPF